MLRFVLFILYQFVEKTNVLGYQTVFEIFRLTLHKNVSDKEDHLQAIVVFFDKI